MPKTKNRPKLKKPESVDEMFGAGIEGNLLKGEYHRDDVYAWFQKRHLKGNTLLTSDGYWERNGHRWKVPYGVRVALKEKLSFAMIASKYPFYATWISPKTGHRLKKYFMSLPAAIDFVASKAQYVDPSASVVSRLGFYIPTPIAGKFPRRMGDRKLVHYWCPRCMDARRFRRNGEDFLGQKKFPEYNKQGEQIGWEWRQVRLAVLECTVCGITNRDGKFRASNQPVEKRKFKRGVTRARRKK